MIRNLLMKLKRHNWRRRAFRWRLAWYYRDVESGAAYARLCAERWAELEREYQEAIRKLFWGEKP